MLGGAETNAEALRRLLLSCPLNLKFSALIANRSRRRMPEAAYTYADTVCASYYAGM